MSTFEQALLNTLMGMGTVFVVLIFISLLISLFVYIPVLEKKITNAFSAKKKQADREEHPAPKRPVIESEEQVESTFMDEGELIAVITAAIAAASGGAVSADKLVVHSIRRVKRR